MSRNETDETLTLAVHEETARVEKRAVEEQAFVRTKAHEHDEVIETLLQSEALDIERVKLDRIVHTASGIREEGDLLIVLVLEEVLV